MIKRLVNIGKVKSTGDPAKDFSNLTKLIEKELDHIRLKASVSAPAQVTTNTTVINSAGGSGTTASSTPKAGIHSIISVSDQFVPFTGDPISSYVLTAYFLDSSGQFANMPVSQSDWASTGFTIREAYIPSIGMLFYIAVPVN